VFKIIRVKEADQTAMVAKSKLSKLR